MYENFKNKLVVVRFIDLQGKTKQTILRMLEVDSEMILFESPTRHAKLLLNKQKIDVIRPLPIEQYKVDLNI